MNKSNRRGMIAKLYVVYVRGDVVNTTIIVGYILQKKCIIAFSGQLNPLFSLVSNGSESCKH